MLESIIAFFARRHLLSNALFGIVIIGGVMAWQNTNKEELPDFTFDFARIMVTYPGATAHDVEYLVTKPIEEKLRGLDGIHKITSTSKIGRSSISVELERDLDDINKTIGEIRNEVLDVDLPDEIIRDPYVGVFQTSKKAILDIALIHKDEKMLTPEGRQQLQAVALALENQMLTLPEVNSIDRRYFLQEELQIKADPDKLRQYEIPLNTLIKEIKQHHIRRPAGKLTTEDDPQVTLQSELRTAEDIESLIIQGGFEGQVIRVADLAEVNHGTEERETISKVNGHECVMFNVRKNSNIGILTALDQVNDFLATFEQQQLQDSPIQIVPLDDESIDIRNRLRIISINGIIGFGLILISLLFFLNWRSGLWVAMGIPFTFCFTILLASIMGHTINGITLAAVIIVMGIVVDDAIVVAENITRLMHQGMDRFKATVKGTSYVMLPILASIITTCAAFIPLYFFQGRHGKLIEFIPPIIFLMLGASLIESFFILPGHMNLRIKNGKASGQSKAQKVKHWFERVENHYGKFLRINLRFNIIVLAGFCAWVGFAGYMASKKMHYEMFPNEETRDVVLTGHISPQSTREQTAEKVGELEDLLQPYLGKEVVGFRTEIGADRGGNATKGNHFRMVVEIVTADKRELSANEFIENIEAEIEQLEGFIELKFQKSRWGSNSGSPIVLIIQQNDDTQRHALIDELRPLLKSVSGLENVEAHLGHQVPEYRIKLNSEMSTRLSISPGDISSTLRTALAGTVLYEFFNGHQDIYVRLSTQDDAKDDIEKVLSLPVENRRNYMVPLRSVVDVEERIAPKTIFREDLIRTSKIYADIEEENYRTPLEIAEELETSILPPLQAKYPTTRITFGGEVKDSREAASDFKNAVLLVILLIYLILAILFESLWKPILIMLAIPCGVAGIIVAFYFHGKDVYGFYAIIGALGLAGVVVNDAIIMLVKISDDFNWSKPQSEINTQIALSARTRLRAVLLTTLTTVAGILPTAYGWGGADAMLGEMMLALAWGLIFGSCITLLLIPSLFSLSCHIQYFFKGTHHDN